LEGEHAFYFVVQERVRDLRQQARELAEHVEEARRPGQARPALPVAAPHNVPKIIRHDWDSGPRYGNVLGELSASQDIPLYLEEVGEGAGPFGRPEEVRGRDLAEGLGVLQGVAGGGAAGEEQVLLYLWTANPGGRERVEQLASCYGTAFPGQR